MKQTKKGRLWPNASRNIACRNALPGSWTIRVKRQLNSTEVIAEAVRDWIKAVGGKSAYIEPGSPWETGYCESFNWGMRPSHTCFACAAG